MKHRSIIGPFALLVALLLGACAPPNQGGQSSTGATPGAASSAPAATDSAEPMSTDSADPTPYDY